MVATVTTGYWFGKQHQLQQPAASSASTTSANSTSSNSTSTSTTSNISSSIVAQVEAEAGAVTYKAEEIVGGEAAMAVIFREIWLCVLGCSGLLDHSFGEIGQAMSGLHSVSILVQSAAIEATSSKLIIGSIEL